MRLEDSRPGRLRIGVVGAGRVGAVLGSSLGRAGHEIIGASAVSQASHDRIEALLPGVAIREIDEIVAGADLVLVTVPDDVLGELVSGLAELGHFAPGQIVAHTAGRFGTSVLGPAANAGALPLALHPAMTFTGTSLDLDRLMDCPIAVTAAPTVLPIGQALAVEIGGEPVVLEEENRALYHAALSHGANHLLTLVTQATRLLARAGIDDTGSYLHPLLAAALDGALRDGEAALTGPVARGDAGAVADHLAELQAAAVAAPELIDIAASYRELARATTQRALATNRLTEARAAALLSEIAPSTKAPMPDATSQDTTTPLGAEVGAADEAVEHSITEPLLVETREELAAALEDDAGRRGVVMTMGALHEGHLDLVKAARQDADQVVVTIFVNPLQFGAGEDFTTYPRDLATDLVRLAEVGADIVFAPAEEIIYPTGQPDLRIDPGPKGEIIEGAMRPGHFAGALTVVAKLLHLTKPDAAFFGQKDAQQLALVRAMVNDLDFGVEIVAVPTRRDADGLALSSRNVYLSGSERQAALALPRALEAARNTATGGATAVLEAAGDVLSGEDNVAVDYLLLVDPITLEELPARATGAALLLIAAHIGPTHLLDNTELQLGGAGRHCEEETEEGSS